MDFGESSCAVIEIEVELASYETKEVVFVLGQEKDLISCKEKSYQYTKIANAKAELEETKKHWEELLHKIQVETPLESANILLNGWLMYQTVTARLWGKTGFYQSGGAIGFRDQLQDTLACKYIKPEWMKKQLLTAAAHQFIEGDVEHWWHEETQRGIRTRFSDDRLWLVYVLGEYIRVTGDMGVLEEKVPYIQGELLNPGEDEKYDIHLPSDTQETLYEHAKRAVDISLNFGENGLPKIGTGDWNDGFSTVGNKGKGESVWLGFFLYDVLSKFIPIVNQKGEYELAAEYEDIQIKLKKALNTKRMGWKMVQTSFYG